VSGAIGDERYHRGVSRGAAIASLSVTESFGVDAQPLHDAVELDPPGAERARRLGDVPAGGGQRVDQALLRLAILRRVADG